MGDFTWEDVLRLTGSIDLRTQTMDQARNTAQEQLNAFGNQVGGDFEAGARTIDAAQGPGAASSYRAQIAMLQTIAGNPVTVSAPNVNESTLNPILADLITRAQGAGAIPSMPHPDASNLALGPNLGGQDAVYDRAGGAGSGAGASSGAGGLLLLGGGLLVALLLFRK